MPSFIHVCVMDFLAIPCLNEPLLGPKMTSDILSQMSGGGGLRALQGQWRSERDWAISSIAFSVGANEADLQV